jgi:hypothetical protein
MMADALQDAAEALIEQLIEKGKATLAKEQALLDLLTRDAGLTLPTRASSNSDD